MSRDVEGLETGSEGGEITLIAFRVVLLGAESIARGRTIKLEAVDLTSASDQVKGMVSDRDYLIILESNYVARGRANRSRYSVNELYGLKEDREVNGPGLGQAPA